MKAYTKKNNISYTNGVYPTLELVKYKSEKVERIIIHAKGQNNYWIDQVAKICVPINIPSERKS